MCFSELLHTLFCVLNYFLEILAAVFKDEILGCLAILTPGIIDIKHPYHIFAIFELVQHLEFA